MFVCGRVVAVSEHVGGKEHSGRFGVSIVRRT